MSRSVCVRWWKLDDWGGWCDGSVTVNVPESTHKPSATPENNSRYKDDMSSTLSIFFCCKCYNEIEIRSELLCRVHLLTFNTFKRAFAVYCILSAVCNALLKSSSKVYWYIINLCYCWVNCESSNISKNSRKTRKVLNQEISDGQKELFEETIRDKHISYFCPFNKDLYENWRFSLTCNGSAI